jgi:predicted regulator of Ras-like GTPase activity (Roadblock/LC7/MglB family)
MENDPIEQALSHTTTRELDWLLADLLQKMPSSWAALLLTVDGLPKAAVGIEDAQAKDLAATASSMFSCALAASKPLDEKPTVRQLIAELDDMLLFICAAGAGSVLAVATSRQADPQHVGYEMTRLVQRLEPHLETPSLPHPRPAN